jgi:hypothetical protein
VVTEHQALDMAAVLRGINNTFPLLKSVELVQSKMGVMCYVSVRSWPRIIGVALWELQKARKKGGRDLLVDCGEEYGLCARIAMEERRLKRRSQG